MGKKYFLITIDTEGDNLWAWKQGQKITTENTLYLKRFQTLCNSFGFKPVWLSNWEMIQDNRFVEFARSIEEEKIGEIGMHLHAWNSLPLFELQHFEGSEAPYLIEYPTAVMEDKIKTLTQEIEEKIGIKPTSHRAGRWATDERYFNLLKKYGYTVDCSVTPTINWQNKCGQSPLSKGTNYLNAPNSSYWIDEKKELLEVPVTIKKSHKLFSPRKTTPRAIAASFYHALIGESLWLRPNGNNLEQMKYVLKLSLKNNSEYVMFMLHSSELMPGGSPTFKDAESIEKLYSDLNDLFSFASNYYEGITLRDYRRIANHE